MIIVSGRIPGSPERRDAFLAAREAVVQARRAPGCRDFGVAADPLEPDRVNVYEEWDSEHALEAFRGAGPEPELTTDIMYADVVRHQVIASGPRVSTEPGQVQNAPGGDSAHRPTRCPGSAGSKSATSSPPLERELRRDGDAPKVRGFAGGLCHHRRERSLLQTRPEVYRTALALLGLQPGEVLMVAAHNYGLDAARGEGMRTAFVPRLEEYGPKQTTDLVADKDWDIVVSDFEDLAGRLGC